MHCFKCGAALPPETATCPTCGAVTPYNVTASTAEPFNARPDSAIPDNTSEEKVPPPVLSQAEETPQVERTVLQLPPQPEAAESKNVERTVLQEPPAQSTPAPQAVVERTVLQQPPQLNKAQSAPAQQPGSPQPTPPSSSPSWQQPQPMQGQQPGPSQPLPGQQAQPGAAQPQQGQSWPQQGPWQQPGPSQPQQPWPQPFPGQQPPQQGPWQPQPGMPQPFPGQQGQPVAPQSYPAWQQPGAVQPQQAQPWPQSFPAQPQPAVSQPLPGQPWPQPFPGQPQFQSGPAWQQPQIGMAQPIPLQQAVQATPAPAAQALPVQQRGLSLERILLLIIIAFTVIGGSGLTYYIAAAHPANLHAQATSVAQDFLTAQAQSMTPEGIYTQATSGKPVINDPLSSPNSSSWQTGFDCAFTEGAYHVTVHQVARIAICLARGSFSDFAFQVQMTIINGQAGGLVFRADGSLSRSYVFGIAASGQYSLALGEGNSQGKTLNYSSSPAIKAGPNQSNLLTVVARGSNIYLYINKQFVASVHDSTYSLGQIGLLATSSASPSADVAFSNAQVWKL